MIHRRQHQKAPHVRLIDGETWNVVDVLGWILPRYFKWWHWHGDSMYNIVRPGEARDGKTGESNNHVKWDIHQQSPPFISFWSSCHLLPSRSSLQRKEACKEDFSEVAPTPSFQSYLVPFVGLTARYTRPSINGLWPGRETGDINWFKELVLARNHWLNLPGPSVIRPGQASPSQPQSFANSSVCVTFFEGPQWRKTKELPGSYFLLPLFDDRLIFLSSA